ncbi:amidohydrolase family protein [Sphingobium sp. EM0848]|uniref:amidohydrolase family protein n=1 Tax=Sphingobium sp. EM0848 TaxID=2743473 RepID=UPI00159C8714|nr:amidohydrolase family protein [Sphingobium sp. EM0848]
MIIDSHAHLVTPLSLLGIRAGLEVSGGQHSLKWLQAMLPQADLDAALEKNIATMDDVGTDMQIISPRPFTLMHSHNRFDDVDLWVRLQNDIIHANVEKYPKRFRGMAALPQVNGMPIETVFGELDRCINELGFVGILLNPDPSEGKGDSPHIGEEYWYPLWERLAEMDVPALIHSAGCCGRETYDEHFATEESMAITKLSHSDIFDRHPGLKIIVSHGGGAIPYQIGRWRSHWLMTQAAENPSIAAFLKDLQAAAKAGKPLPQAPDELVTFDEMLKKFYFDTDVHDPESMKLLFGKVGVDRCLFGTERPGSGGGIDLNTGRPMDDLKFTIDNLDTLTVEDRRKLYQDNALKVFTRIPRDIVEGRLDG